MPSSSGFDPHDAAFRADPYPTYASLREHEPVHVTDEGAYVLSRYRDCSLALRHPAMVSRGPEDPPSRRPHGEDERVERQALAPESLRVLGNSMLFMDPPDHTRLRGLVNQAFSRRRVEDLLPGVHTIADELCDAAAERGEMDVVGDFAYPLPVRVICSMLDIPAADHDAFGEHARHLAGVVDIVTDPKTVERGAQAAAWFLDYFEGLIAERRRGEGDDLVTALIEAEESGDRLNHSELLATLVQLLFAGHETTQNLIGNGTWALLSQRDRWAELCADPVLARAATEEMLRYDSPAQLAGRWTGADVELGGTTIPAGRQVVALIGSANRDPAEFEDPDRIDLGRSHNPHLTFGAGHHFCLGGPLARLEGRVAFETLARRFPRMEPLVDEVTYRPTYVLRGIASLEVAI